MYSTYVRTQYMYNLCTYCTVLYCTYNVSYLCCILLALFCLVRVLQCYIYMNICRLNMSHDYYGNKCPLGRGYVMEANLGHGTVLYQWSPCSRQELLEFRLSGATWCLREHTPGYITPPPLPSTPYNLTYQCKKSFGENATACPVSSQPVSC